MSQIISTLHDIVDAVVFGNGWLALGGLGLVAGLVVAVRVFPTVRV